MATTASGQVDIMYTCWQVSHRAFGAVHGRGPLVVPRVTGDDDSRGGPDGSPSPRRMAARDISGSCGLPSKQQVEESQHLHVSIQWSFVAREVSLLVTNHLIVGHLLLQSRCNHLFEQQYHTSG